ncbi:MAG: hypothetical protein IT381_22860 [Deltaproteobacteria bacterium]|nr:hypothetical protein [Deltaproteobacteria bacterium]
MGSGSSGGVSGPRVTPGTIAADANQENIKELEAQAFSGGPIVVQLGMRQVAPKAKSGSGDTGFRQTGDPPAPPSDEPTAGGKEALNNSIQFLGSLAGSDPVGGLWAVMMEYQKMMNKENRDDRKLARADARTELALKAGKFELEKTKITQMKAEASERYEHAMTAANWEMGLGIASCCAAAVSFAGGIGGCPSWVGQLGKGLDVAVKAVQAGATREIAHHKNYGDYQKKMGLASDETQKQIYDQENAINKAGVQASESKDASEASRDRRKSALDNMQKFLDILRSINPQI